MSPDPYNGSFDPSNPQSFNRYAYLVNNPLGFADPSGLNRVCIGSNCGKPAPPDDPKKNKDDGEWYDPVDWPQEIFSLFTGSPSFNGKVAQMMVGPQTLRRRCRTPASRTAY